MGAYRLISLLNHNAKPFTFILAKRLNSFIAEYMHPDQSGFIYEQEKSWIILVSLNIFNYCKVESISVVILGLDAEKAFDFMETSYIQVLLQEINFDPNFLMAIKVLYAKPVTQLMINGIRSEDFKLTRETRQ